LRRPNLLKYLAGPEIGGGNFLSDTSPEEKAAELRAAPDFRDTMIVALTGWGQPDDRNRSLAAGFDHHVVKPVDPSMLERLLAAPGKKKGPACRGEDGPRGGVEPARQGLLQGAPRPELR
jgi:hypothetical protein